MYNERVKEVHEGHIIGFSEKKLVFWQMGHYGPNFGPKMTDSCSLCPKDFFKILYSESGQQEDYIVYFSKKSLI